MKTALPLPLPSTNDAPVLPPVRVSGVEAGAVRLAEIGVTSVGEVARTASPVPVVGNRSAGGMTTVEDIVNCVSATLPNHPKTSWQEET